MRLHKLVIAFVAKAETPRQFVDLWKADHTEEALTQIEGDTKQQIWQDHLLALAMLQHSGHRWAWAQFVVAYPAANPSFAAGVTEYATLLGDSATFAGRTLDSLIDQPGALPTD